MIQYGRDSNGALRLAVDGAIQPTIVPGVAIKHVILAAGKLAKELKGAHHIEAYKGVWRVAFVDPNAEEQPTEAEKEEAVDLNGLDALLGLSIPKLDKALETGEHDDVLGELLDLEKAKGDEKRSGAIKAIEVRQRKVIDDAGE